MRTAELPSQLVHGDFWDNNVLFEGPAVAAVLEVAGRIPRRRDVGGHVRRYLDVSLADQRQALGDGRGVRQNRRS